MLMDDLLLKQEQVHGDNYAILLYSDMISFSECISQPSYYKQNITHELFYLGLSQQCYLIETIIS